MIPLITGIAQSRLGRWFFSALLCAVLVWFLLSWYSGKVADAYEAGYNAGVAEEQAAQGEALAEAARVVQGYREQFNQRAAEAQRKAQAQQRVTQDVQEQARGVHGRLSDDALRLLNRPIQAGNGAMSVD